jgi:hypothetical protein
MTEEFILDNIHRLMATVREANVVTRWVLLHISSQNRRLQDLLSPFVSQRVLLVQLMIDTAHFEFLLKETVKTLIASKKERWDEYKKQGGERMQELCKFGWKGIVSDAGWVYCTGGYIFFLILGCDLFCYILGYDLVLFSIFWELNMFFYFSNGCFADN